jgi:hypothetical protein
MSIGSWFKRLIGSSGGTVPCALCRCPIPPGDLKKGSALVIARREFCRGCVEEITRHAAQPDVPGWTLDLGSSSTVLLR